MKGMTYTEGIGWHAVDSHLASQVKFYTVKTPEGPVRKSKARPLAGDHGTNPAFIRVPR